MPFARSLTQARPGAMPGEEKSDIRMAKSERISNSEDRSPKGDGGRRGVVEIRNPNHAKFDPLRRGDSATRRYQATQQGQRNFLCLEKSNFV